MEGKSVTTETIKQGKEKKKGVLGNEAETLTVC